MVLNILNKHAEIWIQLAVTVRDRSLTDVSMHGYIRSSRTILA